MKKQSFVILLSCTVLLAAGQPSPQAVKYASLVAENGLRDKLSIIASDALEGRMTGTRGQKMAAAFIAHHFREIGLKGPVNGSYEQTVPLVKISPGENLLSAGTEPFGAFSDYFKRPASLALYGVDEGQDSRLAPDLVCVGNYFTSKCNPASKRAKILNLFSSHIATVCVLIVEAFINIWR